MEYFRFTLFNSITLLILVATLVLLWRRFAGPLAVNWPLAYYAVLAVYTSGFSGGLNPYWVAAGAACALAIRFGFYPARMRFGEAIPLGYVAWRCVGLILMW